MMDKTYDIAVIGTGPGGYVAAIRAAQLGMETVVIEKAEIGGICLNWGCIPTKALIRSAELFQSMKHAADFGILAPDVSVDFTKMIKRSRQVANRLSKGVEFLFKKNNITHIAGNASLVNANTLEVNSQEGTKRISAKNIIIATGARPRALPNVEFDGEKIITSKEAMILPELPNSMAIIGAGAIGVEFAYFYSSLGTKVTLIEMMPNILPLEDVEIVDVVARSYKKQGITILTESKVQRFEKENNSVALSINGNNGEQKITADIALVAIGVQGNVEGIGLESVGINVEKGFIQVDKSTYLTSAEGVYAIGDVIGPPWLAHVASAEGIAVVENIAGKSSVVDYNNIPGCTYCQPQVASLGLTEEKAKDRGSKIKVGRFPFRANGKSLAMGHSEGLVKLIFDDINGELLGAHIVGAEATEMLAELGLGKTLETTGKEIFKTVHAHPTLSETIMEAAANAYGEAIHI
jgi:dihydrolipoamide dehydrogenase